MSKNVDLITNIASKLRSWFVLAMVMLGANLFLVTQIASNATSQPTRLIPCNFNQAEGPMEVTNFGEGNQAYISMIAEGDIQLLTTWNPKTVKDRYARLLNRMTPDMFAANSAKMISDAELLNNLAQSQYLMISKIYANEENSVEIHGTFRMSEASELMLNEERRYRLDYVYISGVPFIAGIEDITNVRKKGGEK